MRAKYIALLIISMFALSASAEKVTLAVGDWSPFFGKNLKEGGVTTHLTKKILEDAGYEVEITWAPWQRALKMVEKGQVDLTSGWGENAERKAKFHYSEDAILVGQEVYIHDANVTLPSNKFADLKGLKFTAVKGYDYSKEFMDAWTGGSADVLGVKTDAEMFKAILSGKAQLFSTDKTVGLSMMNDQFGADKAKFKISEPFSESQYFILVGKSNPKGAELVKKISASLKKLKANGTFDKLYEDNIKGLYK